MGVEWSSPRPEPASRRQRALILAGAAGLLWAAWTGQPDVGEAATTPDIMSPAGATSPQQDCQEDDPCWDCETMGNLVCGPGHGAPVPQRLPATG